MKLIDITNQPADDAAAETGVHDLTSLSRVVLSDNRQAMLAFVSGAQNSGDPFLARAVQEAREVLALSEIAPPGRLRVDWIDITGEILAIVMLMRVTVPRVPDENNHLRLGQLVTLGLMYPREAMGQSLPGTAFFDVLQPADVWHPNVSLPGVSPIPRLCLGTDMMPGIRCVDLILMAYGALSMQSLQIDERDPAGIMNFAAAQWWQQNLHRLPLSRTPFLQPDVSNSASPLPTT